MRLGHFTDFQSRPSVLLLSSGEPDDFRRLHDALRSLEVDASISLDRLARVRARNGITLDVRRGNSDSLSRASDTAFVWAVDPETLAEVLDKIQPLMLALQGGHQYFDYDEHTVVMSIAEYGDAWWQRTGG